MPLSRLASPLKMLDVWWLLRPSGHDTRRPAAVKHRILGILDDYTSSSVGIRGILRRVAVKHSHGIGFSDSVSHSTFLGCLYGYGIA